MDFPRVFRNTFQEILIKPVHALARGNHKSIKNQWFHNYFNNFYIIKSAYKVIIHHILRGLLFILYACNTVPVDGMEKFQSIVAIRRYLLFPIDLSPENSREFNSEGQKYLNYFEAASLILFRQIYRFNILVFSRRPRHRYLRNKVNLMREFDTGCSVVVNNKVGSSSK